MLVGTCVVKEKELKTTEEFKGFCYLIQIKPLGMIYGSAGAFLSPENLVGRSGSKFPPDAATLSGLFFSANYQNQELKEELREQLFVAGPFWAENERPQKIYVPIPWHKVIGKDSNGKDDWDEWTLREKDGVRVWHRAKPDLEPSYTWQRIDDWYEDPQAMIKRKTAKASPWQFTPMLHPKMHEGDRSTLPQDGLFLENAVQMQEGTSLIYLASHSLESGWYKFGGENHLVEIESIEIKQQGPLNKLLNQPIAKAFASIVPSVWGSNRFSYRYPQHPNFPKIGPMLTDKPQPYRHSAGGKLGRGRYAVPPGSVYVLEESFPEPQPWWKWDLEWFPHRGYPLKHIGSGLCLPVQINGL